MMKRETATTVEVETKPLYSVEDYRPEDNVGLLIGMVRAKLMAALDDELVDLGLTASQLPVLDRISRTQEATAATLCRRTGADTGSMTRMLDRLEEKGFIRRVRSQADRRIVHLELTEAGKALWPMIMPRVVKVLNRLLTGFSHEDMELLKSLLRRILTNV